MGRIAWAALLLATAAPLAAQPLDSLATRLDTPTLADTVAGPTARGAVLRALALPGFGQVYVGQRAKAPFAFAFVAGAAVYFVTRQRQYLRYRRASVVAGCLVDDGSADDDADRIALCAAAGADYQDEYDAVNEGLATPATFIAIRSVRETARGQRDVGALVVLAAYALQALDAYVAAELSDFDVSEDLSIGVRPESGQLALRLRW
ncbi:DUF5683 domain-containing protein [Rubrivirga sp. IMCC45206]|uniref:DUF5683 domain-containing protein n=1 Tax=Rubrivirga sp. IMCC45206 TaxID=3391614 RepID=UPI00398FE959